MVKLNPFQRTEPNMAIIENSSIRSGVALFAASSVYCVLGKFKNISECSWKVQIGAFGLTALAKTIMDAICENHKDDGTPAAPCAILPV